MPFLKKKVSLYVDSSRLSAAVSIIFGRVCVREGDKATGWRDSAAGFSETALIIGGEHLTLSRAGRWWVEAGSEGGDLHPLSGRTNSTKRQ